MHLAIRLPLATKNGESYDIGRSIIMEIRRSDNESISAIANARLSSTMATGSA